MFCPKSKLVLYSPLRIRRIDPGNFSIVNIFFGRCRPFCNQNLESFFFSRKKNFLKKKNAEKKIHQHWEKKKNRIESFMKNIKYFMRVIFSCFSCFHESTFRIHFWQANISTVTKSDVRAGHCMSDDTRKPARATTCSRTYEASRGLSARNPFDAPQPFLCLRNEAPVCPALWALTEALVITEVITVRFVVRALKLNFVFLNYSAWFSLESWHKSFVTHDSTVLRRVSQPPGNRLACFSRTIVHFTVCKSASL